jgi:hypothetical protein
MRIYDTRLSIGAYIPGTEDANLALRFYCTLFYKDNTLLGIRCARKSYLRIARASDQDP